MAGAVERVADAPREDTDDSAGHDPVQCQYCGRRFAESDLLALHRGFEHPVDLGEAEREAFEAAYDAEEDELRLFRLKALLALMVLYFLLLFAYSVFG